jgi:DNA-binding transcriptional ArsR family regulator
VTLRIVFGQQDLQRVRLADAADPMWELVFSLYRMQSPSVPAPFLGWRQSLESRLRNTETGHRSVGLLATLVPPVGNFPDFLTPPQLVTDLDAGCEVVACTSSARFNADLAAAFAGRRPPTWARSLAMGDRSQVRELVGAIRDGHNLLVAHQWFDVQEVVALDCAKKTRVLARHGVGQLLASLPGILSWDGQVLQTSYPEDRTVHLAGRGLTLLPSYFCWGNPVTWINPDLSPAAGVSSRPPRPRPSRPADTLILVSLLGHTRADCLRLLLVARTTSELARHLGVSIGTASKQATVLRNARLITTTRNGGAVLHKTTSLGAALLTGRLPAS